LPQSLTVASTTALTCSFFVTSQLYDCALPPALTISATSASSLSLRRAAIETTAPRAARYLAEAAPIPLLAPMMTTTLPSMSWLIVQLPDLRRHDTIRPRVPHHTQMS